MKISLFFAFLALISPYAAKQMENSYNTFINDFNNYIYQKEEESYKEEEIVYEPSPEEIALSMSQDDYALYIPSIYCKAKVHVCDTAEEIINAQHWVDLKDCAADVRYRQSYGESVNEAYDDILFIADHSNQGFSYLPYIEKGARAYIAKGSEIKTYVCTDVFIAQMTYVTYNSCMSQVPIDKKTGKNLLKDSDADLVCMTCADFSGGRYIVYFNEI